MTSNNNRLFPDFWTKGMEFAFVFLFFLMPVFMFAQMNSLIPDKYLGEEASETLNNWKNSGSSIINAYEKKGEKIRIDYFIDVSEEGIFPGKDPIGDRFNQLLKKIKDVKAWKLVYFPKGTYVIDKEIVIDFSQIIIKGETYSKSEKEATYFKFELPKEVKNCILLKNERIGLEDFILEDKNISAQANKIKGKCRIRKSIRLAADECWLRGIKSKKTNYGHISIRGNHNTVSGCTFFDAHEYGGGGEGYGIQIGTFASHNRIENNVLSSLRHSIVLSAEPRFNVIAYNYSFDVTSTSCGGWIIDEGCGDIQLHGNGSNPKYSGPELNLFEANIVEKVVIDYAHKHNGKNNLFFRNSSKQGLGIEESVKQTQYQQNIIAFHGECSCPWFSDACDKLLQLGYHKFWGVKDTYLDIPEKYSSFYLSQKPDWYSEQWPFALKGDYSKEYNPAKRRQMQAKITPFVCGFDLFDIESLNKKK